MKLRKIASLILSVLLLAALAVPASAHGPHHGQSGSPSCNYALPEWAEDEGASGTSGSAYDLPDWAESDSSQNGTSRSTQPHCPKGYHSSGWYSKEAGATSAYVGDARTGEIIEVLPKLNEVCPDFLKGTCNADVSVYVTDEDGNVVEKVIPELKGVCTAADLKMLPSCSGHPLVDVIMSPVLSHLCHIN